MKKFTALLLASLIACAQAQAASFDCSKARSVPEKLICANGELSERDQRLGDIYQNLLRILDTANARKLRQEQALWLRSKRDACGSASCLMLAYASREHQLDPLADHRLTCQEMRRFPERAFSMGEIDLGSGYGSPNDVDYACPESLSMQAFMQKLLALAERIRGEREPQLCSGSIFYAQERYYQFSLTAAGFLPEALARDEAPFAGLSWEGMLAAPGNEEFGKRMNFFRQWSELSRGNFARYSAFASEFDRVLPVLARHYETKLGRPAAQALFAARTVLMLVAGRAAGSSPSADFRADPDLVERVRAGLVAPQALRRLAAGRADTEIYEALVVALIHDRPLPLVSVLAESVTPAALAELGKDKEPLLSFALGNRQHLDYLLGLKTAASLVNAGNDFGKTALYYAIGMNDERAVAALLKAGANVNHAYKSEKELRPDEYSCVHPLLTHTRRTPLMHAAQHASLPILKMLVQAGARLGAVDGLDANAVNYAITGKKRDNERYLRSLGLSAAALR